MNEILHSWMPILLAASWQAAFLVLAVFVITWLMGNRLSASWQRVLWLIPVLRFVVLIVPASNLSVFQMLPSFERWQPEPPPLASVATSSDGAAVNTLASRSAADDRSSVSGQQASFSHNPNSEPVQTQPKDKLVYSQTDHMDASESSSGEAEEPWSFRPMLIFASIWIAGTSFFLLRYAAVCFSLLRLVRRAQTGQDNTTLILIDRLKSQIGIKRSVQILYSDKIISPATTGILRPVILLPSVDSSRLHAEDLEMVLTHELMHIKRFDLAWILVANLAHALHWFNPLVYLAVDRLKQAMEAAADERAIHHLGTERLESYVELLMRLAAPPSSPSSALLAIASRRQQIKNRLERLVDGKPFSIWNWGLGAVIAILLVATGMTTGYVTGGSPQPQPVATNPVSQFSLQEDLTESNVVERKEDENVLRGKVLDHKGEPLPGAIVASQHVDEGLKELQALCNANGEFELRLPSKQKFNGIESYLSAFKPGYPLRTMNVAAHIWERRNEEQRAIEIRLPEQQSYEIRIEKANGEPLAHQEVWLENVQFPNGVSVADKPTGLTGPLPNLLKEQTKVETDAEGKVSITSCPKALLADILVKGKGLGQQRIGIRPDQQDYRVSEVGAFRAEFQTKDPAELAGLKVFLSTTSFGDHRITGYAEVVVDENGKLEVPEIAAGQLNLQIQWEPGQAIYPVHFIRGRSSIVAGETTIAKSDSKPRKMVRVSGKIVTPSGKGVEGARVSFRDVRGWAPRVKTAEDGSYEAEICSGDAQLQVVSLGEDRQVYQDYDHPEIQKMTLPDSVDSMQLGDIILPAKKMLQGKLVDSDGKPLANSVVVIPRSQFGHIMGLGKTDASGDFELRVSNRSLKHLVSRNKEIPFAIRKENGSYGKLPDHIPLRVLRSDEDDLLLELP